METLLQLLGSTAKSRVLRCYKRDDNQVPPQYVLLPVSTIVPASASKDPVIARMGSNTWWELQCSMMAMLRDAVERSSLPASVSWKWMVSITEQEVLRATVFNSSPEVRHRVCSVRDGVFSFPPSHCSFVQDRSVSAAPSLALI